MDLSRLRNAPETLQARLVAVTPYAFLTALLIIDDAIDWVSDQVPWPPFDFFAAFNALIEWFINLVITGILNAVSFFFMLGVEAFLLYENPRHIDVLNQYWEDSLILYLFIIFAMMFAYYVMMMLLADTDDANIQRIVERFILSAIFLAISRDVFGFFVSLTNQMTYGILPESYSFYVQMETLEVMVAGISMSGAALFIAVAGGLGIFVSGIIFYMVLAMRMLIVYVVYALTPVLLALWVVDVGPGKYGKFFADFLFKIAAVMMVLGIVIAGVLSVGAAFGDPSARDGVDTASDIEMENDGTVVKSTSGQYGPRSEFDRSGISADSAGETFQQLSLSLFMFIGSMWLIIALMTSLSGMVMSAGAGSAGGAGGFRGIRGGLRGGGGGRGPGGGPVGAQYGQATAGSAHVYQLDDGRQVIANPAGGGVVVDPSQSEGGWQSFSPDDNPLGSADAPTNPFNTTPDTGDSLSGTSLSEKAGNVKTDVGEALDSRFDDDMVQPTDVAAGAASYLGGIRDSAGAWTPNTMKKAGNLAKRAGSAYHDVMKQPTVNDSLLEADRIIDGPQTPPERPPGAGDGAAITQGADAFEMGRSSVDPDVDMNVDVNEQFESATGTGTTPDAVSTDATSTAGAQAGPGAGTGAGEPGTGAESSTGAADTGESGTATGTPEDTPDVASNTSPGVASSGPSQTGPVSGDEMEEMLDSSPEDFAGYEDASEDVTLNAETGSPVSTDAPRTDPDVDATGDGAVDDESFFDDETTTSGASATDTGTEAGSYDDIPSAVEDDVAAAQDEIDDLRETWSGSSSMENNPFPDYYADAIDESVDLVDEVPDLADDLAEQGFDPEQFGEELSKQGEVVAGTVKETFGQKRPVDLATAQGDLESPDVEFTDSVTTDEVTDMAAQSTGQRESEITDQLSEVKDRAISETAEDVMQRDPAQRIEKNLSEADFDSKEAELAYHIHAKNSARALENTLDKEEFAEFNNRTVF